MSAEEKHFQRDNGPNVDPVGNEVSVVAVKAINQRKTILFYLKKLIKYIIIIY